MNQGLENRRYWSVWASIYQPKHETAHGPQVYTQFKFTPPSMVSLLAEPPGFNN